MGHLKAITPVEWLLRGGVAFAFLYPAISAWFNPFAWIGYFPPFVFDILPFGDMTVLHLFGVTEVIIALWLLLGKKIFWPGVLAAAYWVGIVVFNLSQMDVIFRDISILAMAVALVITARRSGTGPQTPLG